MSDTSPTNLFEVKVPDFFPAEEGRTDRTGKFTAQKRTGRVQMQIECEFARQTEGLSILPEFLAKFAGAMADLKIMIVIAPNMNLPGSSAAPRIWDPEQIDASDPEEVDLLFKVWEEIRKAEVTFREGLAKAR